MTTVKLWNKGNNSIQYGASPKECLRPGKVGLVSPDIAEKLKRLYKGQVVDLEALVDDFEEKEVTKPEAKPAKAAEANKESEAALIEDEGEEKPETDTSEKENTTTAENKNANKNGKKGK